MKLLLLSFILLTLSYASFSKEQNIAQALKQEALNSKIDKRLLYTIAKIESNFEPLIIAFTSTKRLRIEGGRVSVKHLKYKNKYLIQIRGSQKDLETIALYLINQGLNIDIGLMQINSINFTKEELPLLFNPSYNVKKATQVLSQCRAKFGSLKKSIECYNKGNNLGKSYNYYTNFTRHFIRDFGGEK